MHPATRVYADLGSYEEVNEVTSTVAAANGLKEGAWDAALTATRFAEDGLVIAQDIPAPRDAWLVLGGSARSPVWGLM